MYSQIPLSTPRYSKQWAAGKSAIWIVLIILLLYSRGPYLSRIVQFNWIAQKTIVAMQFTPEMLPTLQAQLDNYTTENCHAIWMQGLISQQLHDTATQYAAWKESLGCSSIFIPLLQIVAPDNQQLARQAVERYPNVANAWFWLADLQADASPDSAIAMYYHGLLLDPGNRWRWQQLSNLLVHLPPPVAIEVYTDLGLAEYARSKDDGSIHARFIWARIIGQEYPEEGAAIYYELLHRRPRDGIYWRELADMLREYAPDAAIEAYLQSCKNGDPGKHGCYEAGRLAEKMGRIDDAIQYYRLSVWPPSLEQANRLERQIKDAIIRP